MEMAGQLQNLPRRKRGREEKPTELQQEITRELAADSANFVGTEHNSQCWESCRAGLLAMPRKQKEVVDVVQIQKLIPAVHAAKTSLKESDMCDDCNEDVHIVWVCEACIWHACAQCAAFARTQGWSTALGIVCGPCLKELIQNLCVWQSRHKFVSFRGHSSASQRDSFARVLSTFGVRST